MPIYDPNLQAAAKAGFPPAQARCIAEIADRVRNQAVEHAVTQALDVIERRGKVAQRERRAKRVDLVVMSVAIIVAFFFGLCIGKAFA